MYITHDLLSYSDYSGTTVERVNVEYLRHRHEVQSVPAGDDDIERWTGEIVEEHGYPDYHRIWIRKDVDEEFGYIDSLNDYACLDDDMEYRLVREIEQDAWRSWLRNELDDEDTESVPDEDAFRAYLRAMEVANEYGYVERGGRWYVDTERLRPAYLNILKKR